MRLKSKPQIQKSKHNEREQFLLKWKCLNDTLLTEITHSPDKSKQKRNIDYVYSKVYEANQT